MAQSSDVERLFSWLKTQDLRYREFAASREVSDAVATWPALHRTAAASGRPAEAPAPSGAAAARERLARETAQMPPAAAEAIKAEPPTTVPPQPLAGARLLSALGRRMHAIRQDQEPAVEAAAPAALATSSEPIAPPAAPVDTAAQERARDAAERLRERLDAAMAINPRPTDVPETGDEQRAAGAPQAAARQTAGGAPDRPAPPPQRVRGERFFGGAYGAGERAGSRRGHSLEAVFSRLSGGRSRPLPDPRERSRGAPGLGSVFDRLR